MCLVRFGPAQPQHARMCDILFLPLYFTAAGQNFIRPLATHSRVVCTYWLFFRFQIAQQHLRIINNMPGQDYAESAFLTLTQCQSGRYYFFLFLFCVVVLVTGAG